MALQMLLLLLQVLIPNHRIIISTMYFTINTNKTLMFLIGAVGAGFARVTGDERYIERHEQVRAHRPETFGEGIRTGAQELGHGIKEGITGLVVCHD